MKKKYLYGMIVLAVIFVLCALFGTSNHFFNFYDPNHTKQKTNNSSNNPSTPDKPQTPTGNTEINGYKCETKYCKYVDNTSLINDRYAFISDGDNNIILYDSKESKKIYELSKIVVLNNLYIVTDKNNMYGVLSVSDKVNEVIPLKFTYIEYNDSVNQFMVTTQNNSSYIADINGNTVSPIYYAQIVQYNDKYVVTRKENEYHIFNFNNDEFITEYINSKSLYIELIGDYVGVVSSDYKYVVYDFTNGSRIIAEHQLDTGVSDARARINGSKLEIYRGNTVLKTVDL